LLLPAAEPLLPDPPIIVHGQVSAAGAYPRGGGGIHVNERTAD